MTIETRSEHGCYGGRQGFYSHASTETGTRMNFSVFVPEHARREPLPALYYLAGLTCTEETFMIKAGAQRRAAELGLVLVSCDTSPRGLGYPGEADAWDFGVGAGFYVDATQAPWSKGYRMGSYVNRELPALIEAHFPVRTDRRGIFGHSMGGHGALVTALRDPSRWHSVSALAPIVHPVDVPWGQKAFGHYLGPDRETWKDWDACELLRRGPFPRTILVDQGTADPFLERELKPEALERASREAGQGLTLRRQAGYDHGYYFIQTFVADHLAHHHRLLEGLV
ncbi:MAG TPA: S-formylglutathione hydrolase [Nevskiaceae bacterium]|nr:S-formylglutathione hydrolase [Nevskiaceae bacterium]